MTNTLRLSNDRPPPFAAARRCSSEQFSSRVKNVPSHRRSVSVRENIHRPPQKPPSTFSNFKGDAKTQDIFVEKIESFRGKGNTHKVLFPGTDQFDLERMDMWNHDDICTPCLILQPKNIKEVSSCLKAYVAGYQQCIDNHKNYGAKLEVPRLCIAGGRNSINSMKEGSIVLDLSGMREIKVNSEKQTCTVQGGARVIDLDLKLGDYGLMAVSGTCQNLGVVGCILGGGLGYASGKHGLACDNVLEAEIVLEDGRCKRCSPEKHQDLFWSLCGSGVGIGVVVSVTLRCHKLRNAVLLDYNLHTSSVKQWRSVLERWANWICGDAAEMDKKDDYSKDKGGAPKEVYSQLILPTDSSTVGFLGTSIDPEVVPQSEDYLEQFHYVTKKKSRKHFPFSFFGSSDNHSQSLPTSWEQIPGLKELKDNTFGARSRSHTKFKMLRYCDQLQAHSNEYFKPGNVFFATKFAEHLSKRIIEILIEATIGCMSPKNGSRIFLMSGGNAVNDEPCECAAFDARKMNYIIFIEGRWDTDAEEKELKEKKIVIDWVQWVVEKLHSCEGIQSTPHPETIRDRVSKSGNNRPGFYNFSRKEGMKLRKIKKKRDPKNIFLSTRISYLESTTRVKSESFDKNESNSPSSNESSLDTISNVKFMSILKSNESIEMDLEDGDVHKRNLSSLSDDINNVTVDTIEESDEEFNNFSSSDSFAMKSFDSGECTKAADTPAEHNVEGKFPQNTLGSVSEVRI